MYGLALFVYMLGLMSKPSIVTFPFLLLILDCWPLGRFGDVAASDHVDAVGFSRSRYSLLALRRFLKSKTAVIFFEKVPFLVLSLISFCLSMISISKADDIAYDFAPVRLRIYNLFVSIVKYLGNMAWPVDLSIYYPFPRSIPVEHFLLALSFVLLITIVSVVWRKRHPWLFTGWFWFLIALIPVGGLIQDGYWPEMANRYMYIPMIGLFLMLVWECDARITGGYSRIIKVIICCVLLVYYISLTRVQNLYFSNNYALFTRAAEVTKDNFIVYNNLGATLISLNKIDDAMIYLEKATALNPKYDKALYNYGFCLMKKGDYSNADAYFSRTITVNPRHAAAYANLGLTQLIRGYPNQAKEFFTKALEIDPDDGNIYNTLGVMLREQGKTEEAIRHFQIALEKKPYLVMARLNLSFAYEKAGLYDRAIAEYEALGKISQTDKGMLNYQSAGIYARQNKFEECRNHLELSLKYGFKVFEHMKSDERFKTFRETAIYNQVLVDRDMRHQ
jgi:tetratricopeptide (TPR) repeat protein